MADRNLDSLALSCLIPQLLAGVVTSVPAHFVIDLNGAMGHFPTTALSLPSQKSVGIPSCLKTTASSACQAAVQPLLPLTSSFPLQLQLWHARLYGEIGSPLHGVGDRASSLHSAAGNFLNVNSLILKIRTLRSNMWENCRRSAVQSWSGGDTPPNTSGFSDGDAAVKEPSVADKILRVRN